jgi:hypothetical protein
MIIRMKAKPESEEYKRFENLLGRVLSVSKEELKERMDETKREKRTPERMDTENKRPKSPKS